MANEATPGGRECWRGGRWRSRPGELDGGGGLWAGAGLLGLLRWRLLARGLRLLAWVAPQAFGHPASLEDQHHQATATRPRLPAGQRDLLRH
jgi:hypothetical protein